jgi:hypothetical protein
MSKLKAVANKALVAIEIAPPHLEFKTFKLAKNLMATKN